MSNHVAELQAGSDWGIVQRWHIGALATGIACILFGLYGMTA